LAFSKANISFQILIPENKHTNKTDSLNSILKYTNFIERKTSMEKKMRLFSAFIFGISCRSSEGPKIIEPEEDIIVEDIDGDGYSEEQGDCDDSNELIHPGIDESCDGVDNNCDGEIDENVLTTFYLDEDLDGYGNEFSTTQACEVPNGYVPIGNDCDDGNDSIYPSAVEVCDEIDNNCNDEIDEGVGIEYFIDRDADGFGDENSIEWHCEEMEGVTTIGGDCDDTNAVINPDANEVCDGLDNNCNDTTDEAVTNTYYADTDTDGFGDENSIVEACDKPTGYVDNNEDCNDSDSNIQPTATEQCDSIDNNCDGFIDETGAIGSQGWYLDSDGDGFGDSTNFQISCDQPTGYVSNSSDCNDSDSSISPIATEQCDSIDNDCDGAIDDADGNLTTSTIWYLDHDTDGYGDSNVSLSLCTQPSNYVSDATDCNDFDGSISPGATEICDTIDNDCDGAVDDADTNISYSGSDQYYTDNDGDGFGDTALGIMTCAPSSSMVGIAGDCDDNSITVYPTSDEFCDGVDNNCDGSIDGVDSVDQPTWYIDYDGDGYGSTNLTLVQCSQPSSYILDGSDCNDLDALIHPIADEICDGVDNNCDNSIDGADSIDQNSWYVDSDADGHGDPLVLIEQCDQPSGYVDTPTDCDDSDITANPDETEVCDGVDNNCDGAIDEGSSSGESASCAATSCSQIVTDNPSATDGNYYIEDSTGNPIEVYCEMDFDGGGWMAVYNYVHVGDSNSDATTMHNSLIQNADMLIAVEPDSTSTSIYTQNIPLTDYYEVVYGWAASPTDDVTQYGKYSDSSGLQGECYLDGYCGTNVAVADFYISTTGNTRTIYTGNNPSYPHVGLGFSGQIIVWGFDNNASSYSHWANWYDGNPCCNAGNTSTAQNSGWRYVIYIR
jgi:hypothetical protein